MTTPKGEPIEPRMRVRRGRKLVRIDFRGAEIIDRSEVVNLRLLIDRIPGIKTLQVNLENVHYLPSGFFGVLIDAVIGGLRVELRNAMPEIEKLIWYQKFVKRGVMHA